MSAEAGPIRTHPWPELARAMRGALLRPGSADYEYHRRVWNGAIDRHPLAIARCADAEDIRAAIRFAASERVPLTVRGGGHNVAGLSVRDGALILDLGAMNHVEVDLNARVARVARVEGGALWRDVDATTQPHGLATTGGFVSTTGVGGYTLGGGVGWLMRRCGLAIDNLLEANVMLADGRDIVASAEQNADLFWGLRGGAGGLGVVARFTYRLHSVGDVFAGIAFHPLDAAPGLLRAFRTFAPSAPEACTAMIVFTTAPPLPFLASEVHGQRVIALAYCWSADPVRGAQALAPLTSYGQPLGRHEGVQPYAAWQQTFDPLNPAGEHYYWTTSQLDALDDALIDKLASAASNPPDPLCEVHVHHLGGAVSSIPDEATAFTHRNAPFFINTIGHTSSPENFAAVRDWARGLRASLAPFARAGVQPNFAGDADDLHIHNPAVRARLAALRARYDPDGLLSVVRDS